LVNSKEFVFFFGGFAPVGGIESFCIDLFEALEQWPRTKALLVWTRNRALLGVFDKFNVTIHRSPISRGCRVGLPDYVLALQNWFVLRHARVIVFGKLPRPGVFRLLLLLLARKNGRQAQLVYITPYRPRDHWPVAMPTIYKENLDHIVVQSDTFATDLRALGYEKELSVLPYCPPCTIGRTDPQEDYSSVVRIGFLGRLEPQKNLPYLFQVIRLMRNEIRLEVFGDGSERLRLERLASACSHRVTFHGTISRDDVAAAIDSCDMFVIPSTSEGQCLAALEIIARGKPLIATPVGALPDLMRSGRFGSLIPLNDEANAATLIDKMVDQVRMGEWPGRSIINDYNAIFDHTIVGSSYICLFERLVVC
jgi:glycosyltransferase involved in cell wall biosynthesis